MRMSTLSLPLILSCLAAPAAMAQVRDSVFASYDDYARFVDEKIMTRDFVPLVQVLGGRDEYTAEQLAGVNAQLLNAMPVDFTSVTVFRETDLGGGVRQEARMYWTGELYAFYYAILHDRGDEIVVVNFTLNTSVTEIMSRF